MNNMTFKEKFLFIFLQIITFGFIWIYWNKKNKQVSIENKLSYSKKVNFDIDNLILFIGGIENIKNHTHSHTKIKIEYVDRNKIKIEEIHNIKGISGVFLNDNFLTLIVGTQAKTIFEIIENKKTHY